MGWCVFPPRSPSSPAPANPQIRRCPFAVRLVAKPYPERRAVGYASLKQAPDWMRSLQYLLESLSSSKATASSAPNVAAAPRSPAPRGSRRRPFTAQPTRLEAVDDPLGPLGAPTPPTIEEPPAPPQKEATASRNTRAPPTASTSSVRSLLDSVNLDDDDETPVASGPRIPPPVQPPSGNAPPRQTQPSVSVEQAAKPTFNIQVGDPHKVGDLTSSHTEYSVITKVCSIVSTVLGIDRSNG